MMKMKRWELALVAGLFFTLFWSAGPIRAQAELADKLVRLHVIANSDSDQDQALKLQVRDAVLAATGGENDGLAQENIDQEYLNFIAQAAQQEVYRRGYAYPVQVERLDMYFDTRHYETFSLPAGQYDAVRVTIGQAQGKNWWCVMLPPLCSPTSEDSFIEAAQDAGLKPGEIRFVTRDGAAYSAQFKVVELWGQLVHTVTGK